MRTEPHTPRRGAVLALLVLVAAVFVLYTLLGARVDVPRVHPDELRYALAGSSLADGEGFLIRGEPSGFGPVHAAVLAAVLVVTEDREDAYPLWKATNALLLALSAIPIYLLARRLLGPWWSVAAAALSLAIPSAIYVSVVMTESTAFLAAAWAMLAIVLAIERPSSARQLVAVAAIGIATATRAQFGVLFVAFVAALVGAWVLRPDRQPPRAFAKSLWPPLGVIALGVLAFFARPLITWTSPSESLGPYWELWRGYDPLAVAKWTLYHAADLELYLAVIPFAVAPIVLWRLLGRGIQRSTRESAFAVSFLTLNTGFLLVAGAFSSLPYGYDRLHDRYLFYVAPLWIVVFVKWLADGLPRPFLALATGVGLALVLPAILPFRQLANEAGVDTVPGALWVWLETQAAGPGPVSGRGLLALFVVVLLAATAFVPERLRIVLPVAVLAVFVATSILAWNRMIGAPEDAVFAGGLERAWIDRQLPDDAVVTKLYADRECGSALERHALFLTEFFNATVDHAAYIGNSVPDGLPTKQVDVGAEGTLVLSPGNPLLADYVFTQPGVELEGERVATGTNAALVLWRIGGPVHVTNARSNEDIRNVDCA